MNEERDRLRVLRRQRKAAVTRHLATLDRLVAEKDISGVEERLNGLRGAFSNFQYSQDEYLKVIQDEKREDLVRNFQKIEETYSDGVRAAREWLKLAKSSDPNREEIKMPGVKRKASRTSTMERPSKVVKTSTLEGVALKKDETKPKVPFTPVRLGSKKKSIGAASGSSTGDGSEVTGLRRAATLPLAEESSDSGTKATSSAEPVTSVRRLPSGTSVGSTAAPDKVPKLTSKKSSLVRKESLSEATESTSKSREQSEVVPPPLPPGGLMEIVFSFDTTGSMSSCLKQVRGRISDMMQRLQADIPGIRLAVFAHGDYCDASTYVTKWIDFGATLPELCDFVNNVESTGGGDFDECYELVLRQAGTELSWTPGSQRSLVMIGDATPHQPNYPQNTLKIKWEDECATLRKQGVRIYSVQAMDRSQSTAFYKTMATLTGGLHLKLDQFSNIFDMMMAICYREGGADLLQAYEDEVRDRHAGGPLNKDLEKMFGDLRGGGPSSGFGSPGAVGKSKGKAKATKAAPKTKKPATKGPIVKPKKAATPAKKKPTAKRPAPGDKKKKSGRRIPRENVTEKNFRQKLAKVKWSKWYLGLSRDCPDGDLWSKRRGKKLGYRRSGLFSCSHALGSRVFEIGVQIQKKGKIYVLFATKRTNVKTKSSWDVRLVSNPAIAKQIEKALSNKTEIFVRAGKVDGVKGKTAEANAIDKAMDTLLASYDYAWMKNRGSRKPRTVKKDGTVLSSRLP